MIEYADLRRLFIQVLRDHDKTTFDTLASAVYSQGQKQGVFPNADISQTPGLRLMIHDIAWDLIIDRVLASGVNDGNTEWSWLHLTDFGKDVVRETQPTHYDPDGYLTHISTLCTGLDPVIKEYVKEGLACMRGGLVFAAAVMFGAAAEKAVLLLLKAIGDAETNAKAKKEIERLLDHPGLPSIFKLIQDRIKLLTEGKPPQMPYTVHQGCTEHLLSLLEMIRVHRNDSVHPEAGKCSREKVFSTIQSFPGALEVVYRLVDWFSNNMI